MKIIEYKTLFWCSQKSVMVISLAITHTPNTKWPNQQFNSKAIIHISNWQTKKKNLDYVLKWDGKILAPVRQLYQFSYWFWNRMTNVPNCKQWRQRSGATFCGLWSESTLFSKVFSVINCLTDSEAGRQMSVCVVTSWRSSWPMWAPSGRILVVPLLKYGKNGNTLLTMASLTPEDLGKVPEK